jgi:UDP-N-acetylglucosamine:LPS N-acetylglucosamine transferase
LVDLSLRQLVVAAIDDALDFLDLVDLVFIPAFHLDSATLPGVGTGKVFSGWDCLLLGVDAPQPTPKLYGTHVLLLTGGSDAAGLGVRWPAELVTHLPDGTVVDWVTGPFSPSPQLLAGGLVTFREHQAPSGLSPLMLQASYALTVFGVSFFELLYHGVPTVVYSPYGDRDTPEMAALQQADVALIARTEDEAPQLLRQLMTDDDLADRLSRRAQAKVDGQGGLRFAQAVKERVDSRWHVPT